MHLLNFVYILFQILGHNFLGDKDITLELSQLMDSWIYPRIKDNLGKKSQTKVVYKNEKKNSCTSIIKFHKIILSIIINRWKCCTKKARRST